MVGSLSCDVFDPKGFLVKSIRGAACYGGYVKGDVFHDFKNHTVKLYISGGNIAREMIDGKPSVKYTTSNISETYDRFLGGSYNFNRLNLDENLEYLYKFKDVYFKYNIDTVTEPLREAKKNFGSLSVGESLNNEIVTYAVITINLGQFSSQVQAKDALFFLRNGIYSFNSPTISLFKYFSENLLKGQDLFKLFIFSSVICNLSNIGGRGGEYEFIFRGVATNNNYSFKCMTGEEFWSKIGKSNTSNVDSSHNPFFIRLKATQHKNFVEVIKNIALALKFNLEPPKSILNKLIKIYANWHINFDEKTPSVVRQEIFENYLIK